MKDDPAVAIIQINNEDGLFFWTIQGLRPSLLELYIAPPYGSKYKVLLNNANQKNRDWAHGIIVRIIINEIIKAKYL